MILVDRVLSAEERSDAPTGALLDVTDRVPRSGEGTVSAFLFDWLDALGEPARCRDVARFFELDGHDYWLHVRARIFYALYADARELDRLPDPARAGEVQVAYVPADRAAFWRRWAPGVRVVLPAGAPVREAERSSSLRRVLDLLHRASAGPRHVLPVLSDPPEGLFFSPSSANVAANGTTRDRIIGALLDPSSPGRLRIEYEPPPTRGRAPAASPSSCHRTVSTSAIVATYLFRNPLEPARLLRAHRALSARFATPPPFAPEPGFGDAVWRNRLGTAVRDTAASIVQLHLYRRAFRWFLAETSPRYVVVVGESNAAGRTFVEEAKRRGVLTFGVQHGTIDPGNVDYRSVGPDAARDTPDHFFAWGPRARRFLVEESGWNESRVHVVGQLHADTRAEAAPHTEALAFKRAQGRRLLFFASQQQPQVPRNRLLAAERLARLCVAEDLCCAVKLHPGERDDDLYARAFEAAGGSERLRVLDGDVAGLIAASDMGGTCYSTVIWDTMAMEVPALVFDPYRLDWLRLRDVPSVWHVDDVEGFSSWYEERERHVRANRVIAEDVLGPRDGRVRERMERWIANG